MNKKDFIRKARNILVTAATGAVVTSGLTSCEDKCARDIVNEYSKELKQQNPNAKVDVKLNFPESPDAADYTEVVFDIDKPTDSVAIKQIKEKYLFQMTQYEQMFDSVIIKQQKADAALLNAARKGDLTKVQEALEVMGANVNAQDAKTGNTAIMMAKEKLPFEKAFLIAKYLVAEPGYNPNVENKDGITFMGMMNAELSKGNAAWQSISRKSGMLKPDASRKRNNTEIDKAVTQLQPSYNSLMATYGKEMKIALGYHLSGWIDTDHYHSGRYNKKTATNEDGSTEQYETGNIILGLANEKCDKKSGERIKDIMLSDRTGTLKIEKLNPQTVDFKALANALRIGKMSVQSENIQDILNNIQKNVTKNGDYLSSIKVRHRYHRSSRHEHRKFPRIF